MRAKDFAFASLRTSDCLMCKLTSKIYSEKLNYTFKYKKASTMYPELKE